MIADIDIIFHPTHAGWDCTGKTLEQGIDSQSAIQSFLCIWVVCLKSCFVQTVPLQPVLLAAGAALPGRLSDAVLAAAGRTGLPALQGGAEGVAAPPPALHLPQPAGTADGHPTVLDRRTEQRGLPGRRQRVEGSPNYKRFFAF